MERGIDDAGADGDRRDVLVLDCGVVAYPPAASDGYWRLRWVELGKRRDTTARSEADAIAKAAELAERLVLGAPTSHGRAKGAALVEHYLDPTRRPARGQGWTERYREDQESQCRRFVLPVIGTLTLRDLSRADFQRILDSAPTKPTATKLRQCLSSMVTAGLEEGLLLARQDVLRGVRRRPDPGEEPALEQTRHVEVADIPAADDVHNLARAAAERSGVWWRELEVLLVAYSGMRWGEHAALSADRLNPLRRRILIDRQVIETRHAVKLSAPKNRRRRTTMYPAHTPGSVDLAALVERRLGELAPDGIVFPSPQGQWARRSNYARNIFAPAAAAAGWPRRPDGRLMWHFHSLRHVFATWALGQPGARIEDVSRLLGHSSIRVTQDIYISPDGDLFDRFFDATA